MTLLTAVVWGELTVTVDIFCPLLKWGAGTMADLLGLMGNLYIVTAASKTPLVLYEERRDKQEGI